MYKYRCMHNPDNYSGGDLFRLLANCFLYYCSDSAVFIFPTLLTDIQRPNLNLAQGPHHTWIKLHKYSLCPLYSFTLMHK